MSFTFVIFFSVLFWASIIKHVLSIFL